MIDVLQMVSGADKKSNNRDNCLHDISLRTETSKTKEIVRTAFA